MYEKALYTNIIKEMQIKTTPVRIATMKKKRNTKSWWGCGKREPSCIVGRNVNLHCHYKNQYDVSQKIKNRTTIWSNNFTSECLLFLWMLTQKDTCTTIVTAALFTTAKMWKPLKYLLMDEWIKKCGVYIHIYVYILYMCTHTMAYYMVIERMKILPFFTT